MAVGASFAELAVVMVDAGQGVLAQTRRHARICSFMGIPYFVFAVNKMDLADYREERFLEIQKEIDRLAAALKLSHVKIIPVSATEGDNVTEKSGNMPWYTGEPLLRYLETVDVREQEADSYFCLPVQRVCRPNHEFRGFQGEIASGKSFVGQSIKALPGNETVTIRRILNGDKEVQEAQTGQAVTIQLDREVDVSRGCVLTDSDLLHPAKTVTATILWMEDAYLVPGKEYLVKLGTRKIPGIMKSIEYKIDVNTGESLPADYIKKNEIAVCRLEFAEKIVVTEFQKNKILGAFILIDRVSHMTSACGVVETAAPEKEHIPIGDDRLQYSDYFDMIAVGSGAAVRIRNREIEDIVRLPDYRYTGFPVLDEKGAVLRIRSGEELEAFLREYRHLDEGKRPEFYQRWTESGTVRKVVCTIASG